MRCRLSSSPGPARFIAHRLSLHMATMSPPDTPITAIARVPGFPGQRKNSWPRRDWGVAPAAVRAGGCAAASGTGRYCSCSRVIASHMTRGASARSLGSVALATRPRPRSTSAAPASSGSCFATPRCKSSDPASRGAQYSQIPFSRDDLGLISAIAIKSEITRKKEAQGHRCWTLTEESIGEREFMGEP